MNTVLWLFTIALAIIVTATTIYNLTHDVPSRKWLSFWIIYGYACFWVGIPIVGLFVIGGFFDLQKLFKRLKEENIDDTDDGFVRDTPESSKSLNSK